MLPLYHKKCKIMYTDMDSLKYHIECDDVYDIMKRDIVSSIRAIIRPTPRISLVIKKYWT